ncbi:hypothetical protein PIB30_013434 [Stylosanthes scabra]|uniref:Uncharacterized protein n=1 Tax=Stylosanthes scabra TaxID=79078 RepID=A0ABU6X674_9FABA|nr:hypothetical protein [Stylosanthes scabra]
MVAGKRYRVRTEDEEREVRRIRKALREFFRLWGVFVIGDAIPGLGWLDLGGQVKEMKKTAKEMDEIVSEWLEEHRRRTTTEQDFIDILLSVLESSSHLNGYDLDTVNKATCLVRSLLQMEIPWLICFSVEWPPGTWLNAHVKSHLFRIAVDSKGTEAMIISAATDTTTVTMTWTLSLLLNHRHILKKVQEELDEKVGKERVVNESDINKLTYLEAVVKESMRLYPAGPLSGPREFREDCSLGGYHIKAGTRMFLNPWKLQRDPRVWSDPMEFKPERFLSTHKDVDVKGQHFELLPFGGGRRACPGVLFGLQMTKLVLAAFLHAFEVTTPSNDPVDMSATFGLTIIKTTPLDVLVKPRLSPSLMFCE